MKWPTFRTWKSGTLVCALATLLPVSLPSCITTERVASGLTSPLYATAAPGRTGRLFIVQRTGEIQILNLSNGSVSPFLNISSLVVSGNEQGLLGLAFSPNYATDGRFFVNYTAVADGATHIVEYKVSSGNADIADPGSARLILRIPQPQANHNGGWLQFGPDGYLYIAMGDGGGSNDSDTGHTPEIGNAQDIENNLLGKILRIDPSPALDAYPDDSERNYGIPADNPFVGVAGDDEIWAYGLRNPWRCSFDRLTGDLWIGDVGQGAREEINFAPASSTGGENYGWRLREGKIATPGVGGAAPVGSIDPIYDYTRGTGTFQGRSVTGGYVYRGPIAELQGKYFFADYVNQKVWSITRAGSTYTGLTDWTTQFNPAVGNINGVSSFGEDEDGNLYLVDLDGEVFRVIRKSPFSMATSSVQNQFLRLIGRGQ